MTPRSFPLRHLASLAVAAAVLCLALPARARADEPAKNGAKEAAPTPAPAEKTATTHHQATIAGRKLGYTATAGTYLLKDDAGKAKASMFYVAYVVDGTSDPAQRPVTFCFNGGPGAAAVWVHLGAFGPKRLELDDEGLTASPPGRLVDNGASILDATDLVFVDPISTGFSRPVAGEDPKQFHGVREDVEWVGEFIRLWLVRNQRFASPKFVAGESYGTTRAAGLALQLLDRYGIDLSGVLLLSTVLNWQNQEFHVGNDLPYLIHVPSYAAAAWYHGRLAPDLQKDLGATLAEAERFALGEYATALLAGDRLAPASAHAIAEKLARLTGVSADYALRTNLRIDIFRFLKELLRDQGKTIGRLDARFTGRDLDSAGEVFEFDPSNNTLMAPYVTALNDYLRRELKFEDDAVYEYLSRKVRPWSFGDAENQYLNMAEVLRLAMARNPHLHVLVASGLYDFATPYFDAFYTVDHLGLPPELRDHVKVETYAAGHMMYVKRSEHEKLREDVLALIARATKR